jgi:hypothetical protein
MTTYSRGKEQARPVTDLDEFEIPKPLPNGWRMSTPYSESRKTVEEKEDFDRVVKEMLSRPRPKPYVPTHFEGKLVKDLTGEDKERFIFSLQSPSTQAAMLRQKTRKPEDDNAWLLREMPDTTPSPEAIEAVKTRMATLTPEIILMEKGLKTGRNSLSQSTKGSVTSEKRQAGIEAFTYSKPASLEDSETGRIKRLREIKAVIAQAEAKQEERKEFKPGWIEWIQSKLPDWMWQ